METDAHFTIQDRKTLQELSQSSAVLESKLDRAISDIAALTNNFVTLVQYKELEKEVKDLRSNTTWIVRTILGIIVAAILGLLLIKK